jgi:hypothetical protein
MEFKTGIFSKNKMQVVGLVEIFYSILERYINQSTTVLLTPKQ